MRRLTSRATGGTAGVLVAALALAGVGFWARVLHAPLEAPDPPHVRGRQGFFTGWRRDGDLRWNVLSERAAHRALVVRVEMAEPARARELAERFVSATDGVYEEILIYAYRPASGDRIAERRLRWTSQGGYDELRIPPVPRHAPDRPADREKVP